MQFQPSSVPDEWGTTQDGQTRPRVVKRGIDDAHDEIPDGEFTPSEEKHQKKKKKKRFYTVSIIQYVYGDRFSFLNRGF